MKIFLYIFIIILFNSCHYDKQDKILIENQNESCEMNLDSAYYYLKMIKDNGYLKIDKVGYIVHMNKYQILDCNKNCIIKNIYWNGDYFISKDTLNMDYNPDCKTSLTINTRYFGNNFHGSISEAISDSSRCCLTKIDISHKYITYTLFKSETSEPNFTRNEINNIVNNQIIEYMEKIEKCFGINIIPTINKITIYNNSPEIRNKKVNKIQEYIKEF